MAILTLLLSLFIGFVVFYFVYLWFGIVGVILYMAGFMYLLSKQPNHEESESVEVETDDMFVINQSERIKNITFRK